jgi:hypothetical protein
LLPNTSNGNNGGPFHYVFADGIIENTGGVNINLVMLVLAIW